MTRLEHLLTILSEECAEVAQRSSKACRFGMEEVQPGQTLTNAERLRLEIVDLMAVFGMVIDETGLMIVDKEQKTREINAKVAKVEKYLSYSAECGTLEVRS